MSDQVPEYFVVGRQAKKGRKAKDQFVIFDSKKTKAKLTWTEDLTKATKWWLPAAAIAFVKAASDPQVVGQSSDHRRPQVVPLFRDINVKPEGKEVRGEKEGV